MTKDLIDVVAELGMDRKRLANILERKYEECTELKDVLEQKENEVEKVRQWLERLRKAHVAKAKELQDEIDRQRLINANLVRARFKQAQSIEELREENRKLKNSIRIILEKVGMYSGVRDNFFNHEWSSEND